MKKVGAIEHIQLGGRFYAITDKGVYTLYGMRWCKSPMTAYDVRERAKQEKGDLTCNHTDV